MTSSILERVIRVVMAIGMTPVATIGRIYPFQLPTPWMGNHFSLTEKNSIKMRHRKNAGMADRITDRMVDM